MAVRQPDGPAAGRTPDEPSTLDQTPWDLVTPADPWAHAVTPVDPLVLAPPPPPEPRPAPPQPSPKRVNGRVLAVVVVGLLAAGLFYAWHRYPAARQYPVHADLPATFAGYTRRDDDVSAQAVDRLSAQVHMGGGAFAGVYGSASGDKLTVFGVTGLRLTPGADLHAELNRIAPEYSLGTAHPYSLGVRGAHESCADGRDPDGTDVIVCAWADRGSIATTLITGRSRKDAATLTAQFRDASLEMGFGA